MMPPEENRRETCFMSWDNVRIDTIPNEKTFLFANKVSFAKFIQRALGLAIDNLQSMK